jgi:hypothetical protein
MGGTEIQATWTFAGCPNFHRFEIQKRDVELDWSVVGMTLDPAARQWMGPGPGAGFTEATYRVVVFNMAEESAVSNVVTITGEPPPPPPPPLTPPQLTSVQQIGPMGIHVEWTHTTPPEFQRYEIQQMVDGQWLMVATVMESSARTWDGGPVTFMDATHPVRVVVFGLAGESAASNEMAITPMLPLYGPTITAVQPATPEMARITWEWPGGDFSRFVVQQRVSPTQYEERATITDPAVREWIGPYAITTDPPVPTFRIVVWNTANQPAASEDMGMSG